LPRSGLSNGARFQKTQEQRQIGMEGRARTESAVPIGSEHRQNGAGMPRSEAWTESSRLGWRRPVRR
jgi:hypothetical protein